MGRVPMAHPPVVWNIELSEELADTKIIAEAWDAAGLYQIGYFPGYRWAEWNGRYRDDIRRFVKGDPGMVGAVAARMSGSADIYETSGHEPINSINFVTCHDGFTLNDVVSYNYKHNEANGEGNRDGINDNQSWNCGVEGPTGDLVIESLRHRQVKNFLAITLLALGTPMLLMGDEVRRTQHGNNNAYCQDNALSWFDWTLLERHCDIHRFVRQMIADRLWLSVTREEPSVSLNELLRQAEMQAHGVKLGCPDWGQTSHSLAFTAHVPRRRLLVHLMLNAYWEPLAFELPRVGEGRHNGWRQWMDTSLASPQDICAAETPPLREVEPNHWAACHFA